MSKFTITLSQIRKRENIDGSKFFDLYQRLVLRDETLNDDEKYFLLRLALYFLNSDDNNVIRLGYRIVLRYSNIFGDYAPLRDVALAKDYIPVAKFIERNYHATTSGEKQTFSDLYLEAYQEGFKAESDAPHVYRSLGQMALDDFSENEGNIAIVAPTSYGKSEMIVKKVRSNPGKKICIIVPSKALLAQTKKSLARDESIKTIFKKIITHPDMYRGEDQNFLAVLTQERLLRLLQKHKELSVDLILIDEAHNILENNGRSHLLAQVLLIAQNRKRDVVVNFFTPFLTDVENLRIKNHDIEIKGRPIDEHMKIERFFASDIGLKEHCLYDQFLNQHLPITLDPNISTDIDFILKYKAAKNIVYLNRPMQVEHFSLNIARIKGDIPLTPEIEKIIASIGEFIDPQYNLIKCIRAGVLYHHGGIPDIVRLYVEEIYSKNADFEFIVTTSTLLEGINIPAEKIFILTPRKGRKSLSAAQFKNLIGRVCRFREIFSDTSGSMAMLEPEVYLVKGEYSPKNFSPLSFYRKNVNLSVSVEDEVSNPLLEHTSEVSHEAQDILEFLENMETGASGLENVKSPISDIGRLCYANNVQDFQILPNEAKLVENLDYYKNLELGVISNAEALVEAIVSIFFSGINLDDDSDNIVRLKDNEEARRFYAMFISWRTQGAPYPLMIRRFLNYWQRRELQGEALVYVGSTWGEEVRGGGHRPLYVNMSQKSESERINLAIAKIKDEQEFIDFHILQYLEILFELELLDGDFYDHVKYGTSNKEIICMLKSGFSMELAKRLTEHYRDKLEFDLTQDVIKYDKSLINKMRENGENDILVFEAEGNL